MPVSMNNAVAAATDPHRHTQRGAASASTANAANGQASAVSTPGSANAAPSPSSIVTLSPQAQSISQLASEGVTMTEVSFASLGITPDQVAQVKTPDQAIALMKEVNQRMQSAGLTPQSDASVSQQNFDSLIEQFGGSASQANQLFAAFDSNQNGSISSSEMLGELGGLSGNSTSSAAQTLLGLMDSNHDGNVDQSEFTNFETAFVKNEQTST